ncbi:MAG: HAD family hydrolase [Bacteroidetes bacterium]|nr:HAD family hydrolase [Bacteroidota bacterium]MBU1678974.1 HAD family hydrolase [Bacteroidota bacterium]
MKIELIIFDLDGTLIESHKTIFESTIKALEIVGADSSISESDFRKLIGHHFNDIFFELGITLPSFEEFIEVYKSIYFNFINDSQMYPDVEYTLEQLRSNGIKTALLTTKSQEQAEIILKHFKIDSQFDFILGRRSDVKNKPNAEPILLICDSLKVNTDKTMMVGDTEIDIHCGRNAKVKTCAITHGYRSGAQLKKENPDHIVHSFKEFNELIISQGE